MAFYQRLSSASLSGLGGQSSPFPTLHFSLLSSPLISSLVLLAYLFSHSVSSSTFPSSLSFLSVPFWSEVFFFFYGAVNQRVCVCVWLNTSTWLWSFTIGGFVSSVLHRGPFLSHLLFSPHPFRCPYGVVYVCWCVKVAFRDSVSGSRKVVDIWARPPIKCHPSRTCSWSDRVVWLWLCKGSVRDTVFGFPFTDPGLCTITK